MINEVEQEIEKIRAADRKHEQDRETIRRAGCGQITQVLFEHILRTSSPEKYAVERMARFIAGKNSPDIKMTGTELSTHLQGIGERAYILECGDKSFTSNVLGQNINMRVWKDRYGPIYFERK